MPGISTKWSVLMCIVPTNEVQVLLSYVLYQWGHWNREVKLIARGHTACKIKVADLGIKLESLDSHSSRTTFGECSYERLKFVQGCCCSQMLFGLCE